MIAAASARRNNLARLHKQNFEIRRAVAEHFKARKVHGAHVRVNRQRLRERGKGRRGERAKILAKLSVVRIFPLNVEKERGSGKKKVKQDRYCTSILYLAHITIVLLLRSSRSSDPSICRRPAKWSARNVISLQLKVHQHSGHLDGLLEPMWIRGYSAKTLSQQCN